MSSFEEIRRAALDHLEHVLELAQRLPIRIGHVLGVQQHPHLEPRLKVEAHVAQRALMAVIHRDEQVRMREVGGLDHPRAWPLTR